MSTVSSLLLTGCPAPGRRAPIGMFKLAWRMATTANEKCPALKQIKFPVSVLLNVCVLYVYPPAGSSKPLVPNMNPTPRFARCPQKRLKLLWNSAHTHTQTQTCLLPWCAIAACCLGFELFCTVLFCNVLYISSSCTAVQRGNVLCQWGDSVLSPQYFSVRTRC